ncbi:MAG: phosphatidate cytidylyltransferase [Proteobacteria bacterium]|nr:phosphatidate cytidylyltransferase [Pseudomonadota bacterium]
MTINFFLKTKNFLNVKNLKTRFITTLVLISIFSGLFFLGEFVLSLFLILLFGGLLFELKKNYSIKNNFFVFIEIAIIPIFLLLYLLSKFNYISFNYINFNMFLIDDYKFFLFTSLLITGVIFFSLKNIFYYLISFLLVLSFYAVIDILLNNNGLYIIFYLVTLVTSMDIFGYIGGNLLGKNKIAPKISNGKTVEGTVIGLFFTVIISCFFIEILSFNYITAIILGIVVGFLAFLGDLLESSFKRKIGIKDSGNIIPGHGGLLDRFDGYILVFSLSPFFINFLI